MTKNTLRREMILLLAFPLFLPAMFFLWICPTFLRKEIEKISGKLYYKMGKKARQTALENLKSVFGKEKTQAEIEMLAQKVFTNTAGAFLDFFAQSYIKSKKRFFKKIVISVSGEEHLKKAYERGKGVICLIPHLSSWELSAVTPPMLGYRTIAASKPIKGILINKTMVWLRARRGMKNFDRVGSYNTLVQELMHGNCLILMIDQDTKVKGCFVNFFGREAYTPLGAVRLAIDTDAAVVPMAMTRISTGKYRFEILPEMAVIQTDNHKSDLIVNAQAQTETMEYFIHKNLTQWVWMHRRWKTTRESLDEYLRWKKWKDNTLI
jgi:KDO2-lipid IV(A) lauroyltransferase